MRAKEKGKLLLVKTDEIDNYKYDNLISYFKSILLGVSRTKFSRNDGIEVIRKRRKKLFEYSPLGVYKVTEIDTGGKKSGFIAIPLPSRTPSCYIYEDEVMILDE